MKLLFLMSVSGSICMICSIVLQKTVRRFLSYRWQDLMFKTALFLFLIPCPPALFARKYWEYLRGRATVSRMPDIRILPGRASVLLYSHGIIVNRGLHIYMLGTVVLAVIMLFLLLRKLLGYRSEKGLTMAAGVYRRADISEEELEELKEKVHLKRDIQVYTASFPGGAFTMGQFYPVIIIPGNLRREQRDIVLLHEMYHVKRKDILFRFLMMAAICMHWFNPLVYCLRRMFYRNCELNCDELVLRHLSEEQRKLYAREIYLQSEAARKERDILIKLGGNKSLTKERVDNIMMADKKSTGKLAKRLTGAAALVIWIISSLPVFAYDGVAVLKLDGEIEDVREECESFYDSDILVSTNGSVMDEAVNADIRFEEQFVDENGNIYEVDLEKGGRAGCTHPVLTSGTYQKHVKDGSGGCVTTIYAAKRCEECGYVFKGEYISELKYAKCPH